MNLPPAIVFTLFNLTIRIERNKEEFNQKKIKGPVTCPVIVLLHAGNVTDTFVNWIRGRQRFLL